MNVFEAIKKSFGNIHCLNDEVIRGIINEQEMNVFKEYLSRLPMINSWDRISEMKYVCDYIYSDFNVNMNDFIME